VIVAVVNDAGGGGQGGSGSEQRGVMTVFEHNTANVELCD